MPATISTYHLFGTEALPADVVVDGEHARVIDRESGSVLPARKLRIKGSQLNLAPAYSKTSRHQARWSSPYLLISCNALDRYGEAHRSHPPGSLALNHA